MAGFAPPHSRVLSIAKKETCRDAEMVLLPIACWVYDLYPIMQTINDPLSGAVSSAPTAGTPFLSSEEGELALLVLALGAAIIIAQFLALRTKQGTAEDVIRAYTITLIIIGTLVLIVAGYSNDQIAPAMGLFGTIAGYLLSRKGN